MMLNMLYLFLVAALLGVAAHFGERLFAEMNWPRRSAWLLAMIATVALPANAFLTITNTTIMDTNPAFTLPLILELPDVAGIADGTGQATAATSINWPEWQVFSSAFTGVWVASSAAVLLFYLVAAVRLHRIRRTAEQRTIAKRTVLLTENLGPAVIGFFQPRVVLPRWLATQDSDLRTQVLRHENQHIEAHDQRTLFMALLIVAAMPWNIPLWWQLRRLRAAIELDCDARVLRAGADSKRYAEALFTVGQQSSHTPFAALALTEPVSDLERRIQIMLAKVRRLGVFGFGIRATALVVVMAFAIAVQAPNAQQSNEPRSSAANSIAGTPTMRLAVSNHFMKAQICLEENEDMECVRNELDQVRQMPDLSDYERGQMYNFEAFVNFQINDTVGAIAAYETLLALPHAELPAGLIASSLRNLATLYLGDNRYEEGLEHYERWMALPYVTPLSRDHYLHASILYQLERYQAGIAALEQGIASAGDPDRSWYVMLAVMYYELGDMEAYEQTRAWTNERYPGSLPQTMERPEIPLASSADNINGLGFGVSDGEYLPIIKFRPVHPPQATARGLEGQVIVSYTVTKDGSTRDVQVIESTDAVFESAAIEAAQNYRYKPRVIAGRAVEVPGVQTTLRFELDNENAASEN